jgi:hypothetical protein
MTEDENGSRQDPERRGRFRIHGRLRSHSGDRTASRCERHFKVTREVVDVSEDEVNEQIEKHRRERPHLRDRRRARLPMATASRSNYLGKVDGVAFDGGTAEDAELVLGSGRFIPGFEDQLVGVKAGEDKTITVTFPAEYPAANLAGKEATFDVTVKDVAARCRSIEINDELASKLGLESVDQAEGDRPRPDRKPVRQRSPARRSSVSSSTSSTALYQFDTPAAPRRRRVREHLAPDQHRPAAGRQDLRRRRDDGGGSARRISQARRASRSPRSGSLRDRRTGRRSR